MIWTEISNLVCSSFRLVPLPSKTQCLKIVQKISRYLRSHVISRSFTWREMVREFVMTWIAWLNSTRFQCCKMRLLAQFSNTVAKYQTVILNASHFPGARSNSQRLRSDVDNLTSQCANDMWSSWNATNTALQQRVTESTEAHNKLQSHMSKTMQEIYDQVNEKHSFFWSKLQFT